MSIRKRKRFVRDSDTDDSGSDDQILDRKKLRRLFRHYTADSSSSSSSSDESLHQSHPSTPRSPRSLGEEEGGSGTYQPLIEDLNSSCSSLGSLEESFRIQERPTNYCFLTDLSSPQSIYVTNFQENKQELARLLYDFYNQNVFNNQLPVDMEITWSKRFRTTGALTRFYGNADNPFAKIELSDKVCDSAERVRDLLIHEMCHAATWVIDRQPNAGHGWIWRYYCRKAEQHLPDLPPITQYHSFKINYPVVYECSGCHARAGRWKASIDTQRFVCSHCSGAVILVNSI
ncbi:germ cell nuclear acidic protein-like [Engystomops pustulosus]|uniref:germ cell nuclear acidic protein-like n=1 Tax=Engystomops pustulosus TaxID=76066 RepID=UPI003AFB2E52